MSGWRVIQELLLNCVLVEPGDSAQPTGDCGAGPSPGLQVAGEAFDVGAADSEQGQGAGAAPGSELAQVECVRLAGQAAVSGQVPGEGEPFGAGEGGLDRGERGGWGGSDYRGPPGRAGTGRLGLFRSQRLSGKPTVNRLVRSRYATNGRVPEPGRPGEKCSISMVLCLVKGFVWHFPGLIPGVLKRMVNGVFCWVADKTGKVRSGEGKLLSGHARQGRDPGTAGESLAGQHG